MLLLLLLLLWQAIAGRHPTISAAHTEQLALPFKGLLAVAFPGEQPMPLQLRVSVFKDGERLGEEHMMCAAATAKHGTASDLFRQDLNSLCMLSVRIAP